MTHVDRTYHSYIFADCFIEVTTDDHGQTDHLCPDCGRRFLTTKTKGLAAPTDLIREALRRHGYPHRPTTDRPYTRIDRTMTALARVRLPAFARLPAFHVTIGNLHVFRQAQYGDEPPKGIGIAWRDRYAEILPPRLISSDEIRWGLTLATVQWGNQDDFVDHHDADVGTIISWNDDGTMEYDLWHTR